MGVKGKTAIVTGAGNGIGAGIAAELAKRGANVVVNDLKEADALKVASKINTHSSGRAMAVKADITRWDEVKEMVDETVRSFGTVDILINNAGALRDNSILKMPEEDFNLVVNTCLKGSWLCCKAVLGHMRANNWKD